VLTANMKIFYNQFNWDVLESGLIKTIGTPLLNLGELNYYPELTPIDQLQ